MAGDGNQVENTETIEVVDKKRSKSVASRKQADMEDKLERLTKFVADLSDRLEVMEEGKEETLGLLDSLKYSSKEELTELYSVTETHTAENARFKEEMAKFKEGMIKHQEGLQVCMAAIAGGTIAREATPRTKAPEPTKYGGKRDPKELEAFFWAMECYLKYMKIKEDEAMIDTTSSTSKV